MSVQRAQPPELPPLPPTQLLGQLQVLWINSGASLWSSGGGASAGCLRLAEAAFLGYPTPSIQNPLDNLNRGYQPYQLPSWYGYETP